jgi:hypothetical protein
MNSVKCKRDYRRKNIWRGRQIVHLEVSSGHITAVLFLMQEGPNVRMAKETGSLWQGVYSGTTLENCLYEGRAESKSKL